jgi:uncharacterized protein YndB with AHSA1/START domain
MTTTTHVPAIERQLDFRATPARLWRALTDDGELGQWFGKAAHLDLREGGEGWFEWDGHGRVPARIEVYEPITRLSWRWGDVGKSVDERSTLVEFRLDPLPDGGTRLFLRESGFETEGARWGNTEGWLSELSELAQHVASEPFEGGIRRTYALTSSPERVWRAFSEPAELAAWWSGSSSEIEIRAGFEGWWVWPSEGGRFAMRIETVEAPRYLCWSWTPAPGVPLAEATQVLRTEWTLVPREDGGTDLHLFESGFTDATEFGQNGGGWDDDVLPGLRKHLGEA